MKYWAVNDSIVMETLEHMKYLKHHTFLICTKRIERIAPLLPDYSPNIFIGTTVENMEMAVKRIPELLKCSRFKLFLSVEPLFSGIYIPPVLLSKISYAIVGCESGHHARETKLEWIDNLRYQCISAGVPLWVKQVKINGKMVTDYQPLSTIKKKELWQQS